MPTPSFSVARIIQAASPSRVSSDLLEWAERREGEDFIVVRTNHGEFFRPQSETCTCERCEDIWAEDDADFTTVDSRGGEEWCASCVEEYAFYCERSGEYFDLCYSTSVEVDGEIVCYDRYSDEIHYSAQTGEYSFEPFDEEEESGRSGYHSENRNYGYSISKKIGIEIEIDCHANMGEFCDIVRGAGAIAEEDGSLNSHSGVEIVLPPYSYAEFLAGDTAMHEILTPRNIGKFSLEGHSAGIGYGTHVNLSRDWFGGTPHLRKFLLAMDNMETLGKRVAQRDRLYSYARWKALGSKLPRETRRGKYSTVNVDDRRVEVRIFRSNLRIERQLKNIEYCLALVEFSGSLPSLLTLSDEEECEAAFLSFLASKPKKEYAHLRAFLAAIETDED